MYCRIGIIEKKKYLQLDYKIIIISVINKKK